MTVSNTVSKDSTSEPNTPVNTGEPPKKKVRTQLDELIETASWYNTFESTDDDAIQNLDNWYSRRRVRSKTYDEELKEQYQQEQQKKELRKEKAKQAALEKKRRLKEDERAKKQKEQEKKRKELEKKSKELAKRRDEKERKKQKQPKLKKSKQSNKKSNGVAPTKEKTSTPLESDDCEPVKLKKKLVDGYIPFNEGIIDDVQVPISNGFFIDEIYSSQVSSIRDLNFKSAAKTVNEGIKRYKKYEGLDTLNIELSSVVFPKLKESYCLMKPGNFRLDPFHEIGATMEELALNYFPNDYKLTVFNPKSPYNSIVGNYSKALDAENYSKALESIKQFNKLVASIHKNNGFLEHLQSKVTITRSFIHELLAQIYFRSVSLSVEKLKNYKAFSNNVYGELLPNFLSKVYDQVGMSENSKFIDLGSGVGNCVIHAALEYGCESYGCEIMENASDIADIQLVEFETRCKYFGLNPGKVRYFNRESFVNNKNVKSIVDQCDIILVNNYIFTPDLNEEVINLFQDLKVGTKIISLKNLVPAGYVIDFNNVESVINRFKVQKFNLENESVSWTSTGGVYYVSEVMRDINEEFFAVYRGRSSV